MYRQFPYWLGSSRAKWKIKRIGISPKENERFIEIYFILIIKVKSYFYCNLYT